MWWVNKFGSVTGPYSDEQIQRGIQQNVFTKLHKISPDRQHWRRIEQTEFWNPTASGPEILPLPPEVAGVGKIGRIPHSGDESLDGVPSSLDKPQRSENPIVSNGPDAVARPASLRNRFVSTCAVWLAIGGGVVAASLLFLVAWAIFGHSDSGATENTPGANVASVAEVAPVVSTNAAPTNVVAAVEKSLSPNDFEVIKKRIVLIHAEKSNGTGFLVKMDGKKYILTNDHVVRSKTTPEMVLVDGTKITPGAMSVARDRDLARYEVTYDGEYFDASDKIPNNNDEIWIYGNSMGDDVITTLRGFVTGVGSKVLKVNAEIVGGNSGSPIVAKDGSVAAVASYLRRGDEGEDWTTRDTSFDSVRRFGIRFSGVEWVKVERSNYEQCCAILEQLSTYWDYLLPYLVRDDFSDDEWRKLRIPVKSLEHKEINRKAFGSDEAGFHEMLMELSKSYAMQGGSWRKWRKLMAERDSFMKELNKAIDDKEIKLEAARKALREYDVKNKVEKTWDNVKEKHRDFNAKRKEALLMAREFLMRAEWQSPLMKHGYSSDDKRCSVEWYLRWIGKFLDENEQKLKDLNKALKTLENGDEE